MFQSLKFSSTVGNGGQLVLVRQNGNSGRHNNFWKVITIIRDESKRKTLIWTKRVVLVPIVSCNHFPEQISTKGKLF